MSICKIHTNEINITNWVYSYSFDCLVKAKKLETKNALISEKNYKGLMIYLTRYVLSKSAKMLSLHNHKLIEKIEEHERENIWWLMIIC